MEKMISSSGAGVERSHEPAAGRSPRASPKEKEGRIWEIVDQIKASNLNNGGGKRAIGGAWRGENTMSNTDYPKNTRLRTTYSVGREENGVNTRSPLETMRLSHPQ